MQDKRSKVSADEGGSRLERGDRLYDHVAQPRKLVELERLFGPGWMERYRRRPLVDSLFKTKTKGSR